MIKKIPLIMLTAFCCQLANAQLPGYKWVSQMGGTSYDHAMHITNDVYGNVYTIGSFQFTIDANPSSTGTEFLTSNGGLDIIIQKLDADGNFVWARQFGGFSHDYGRSIAVDSNGNVYTTGAYFGTVDFDPDTIGVYNLIAQTNSDIFVSKLDSSGNFVWAKGLGDVGESGLSLDLDEFQNVYITGYFTGNVDFDPGPDSSIVTSYNLNGFGYSDIYVLKLDSLGNFKWVKQLGGGNYDFGYSTTVDDQQNILTTGTFRDTADFDPDTLTILNFISEGGDDIFIQKMDTNGALITAFQIGGPGTDIGHDISIDNLGNIYVTGAFQDTVDFDPSPTDTFNLIANGGSDIFISKYDPIGNYIWAKSIGGIGSDESKSISIDTSGAIYIAGYFTDIVDFDPDSIDTFNVTSAGGTDMFLAKFSSTGDFMGVHTMGGSSNDEVVAISIGGNNEIYLTGKFENTVDFDPDTASSNFLTAVLNTDIFTLKMSNACSSTFGSVTAQSCDNYVGPSGKLFQSSGTHFDTIPNIGGCDSIITLNLTITNSTSNTITATACNTYLSPSGNYTYTGSGTYADTLSNAAGCDSIITINLTLNSNSFDTITTTACDDYLSPSGNVTYTASGTYVDTLSNAAGCDSIITINLTLNSNSFDTITTTACDNYLSPSGNVTYTASGTYLDTVPNGAGCDSIIQISLSIISVDTSVSLSGSTLSSNSSGAAYQWIDCNNANASISGETNQTFNVTANGNYAVAVTENGCTDTSGCYAIAITGILSSSISSSIQVYPNPATDEIFVSGLKDSDNVISIYDVSGKLVLKQTLGKKEQKVNIKTLASGIYILEVRNSSGLLSKKRFTKG